MDITQLREKLNAIDTDLSRLFAERMEIAADVADYKKQNNMPVLDRSREREVISRVTEGQHEEMAEYTKILYSTLFDLSRSYQNRRINLSSPLADRISAAMSSTPDSFPLSATVACQGAEGAYSQLACDRLFSRPNIVFVSSFRGVFAAVESGFCRYGILPIENSVRGSVSQVYDLMKEYKFHIVRSIRMHIRHCLLAKTGTKQSDIKEIFSHEQALGQCSVFLDGFEGVKITVCENTAEAARMVAESNRSDVAAISSLDCADVYGLTPLAEGIQNNDNNYTRFICISRELEIYPGASKLSFMFTLAHQPGSLYRLISKFSARGLNLTKLESRPIPGRDFEFMFYFDMDAPRRDEIISVVAELESEPDKFIFLGCYQEI